MQLMYASSVAFVYWVYRLGLTARFQAALNKCEDNACAIYLQLDCRMFAYHGSANLLDPRLYKADHSIHCCLSLSRALASCSLVFSSLAS